MNAITAIGLKLNTFGYAFYETVPDIIIINEEEVPVPYPYMRWVLDVPLTNFKTQNGLVTVDIWHNLTEEDATDEIEALREAVWVGMDNYKYSDSDVSLSLRQDLNNTVDDPDVNLIRRRVTFQVLF